MEPIEEQTTWKGHAFTLVVFAGIVVLCAIFFILGMLVGRSQGQKVATSAEHEAAAESAAVTEAETNAAAAAAEAPELTFYESVEKNEPAPLEAPRRAAANAVNFQVGAVRQSGDAEKLLNEVKQKGFRAFILAPPSGDPNPFYRIQVGPFTDPAEAEAVRLQLESAGYKSIIKR